MASEDNPLLPSSDGTDEQLIDSIIDELVEQVLANGAADVEGACARFPEQAERIRHAAASLEILMHHQLSQGSEPDRQSLRSKIEQELRTGTLAKLDPTLESFNMSMRNSSSTVSALPEAKVQLPGDRYQIREVLGEGGFGVVYVAEQREPVRRKVAVKVVKPGMGSKEVLARFEAERQALAMMDHPNVARVLDGGVTEDGRPYFVMELIRGISITRFCDMQKLGLDNRLELFRDVCLAVQHAHLKGIIHRDIKPSNVLVTMRDDTPVVKVIDFGVAKALHNQLTDQSIYTAFGQMIGTPLYMSPEQIQLNELDVDTRSDIYSLGVLLYELITGETPFAKASLVAKGIQAFREMVCETDPPRPSHRISTLKASDDPTVVDKRRYDGRELKRLSGELDWIVMKSLEKDRAKRYQSASEFANEIKCLLDGDEILARPPTLLYRASKLVKRNKVLFATGGAVLAAILIGLFTTFSQMRRAVYAEQEALAAVAESEKQRELAEQRLAFAEQAVDDMYVGVANRWIATQPGLTKKQREFLEKAAEIYRQLASVGDGEDLSRVLKAARSTQRVADIERSLGKIENSITSGRNAIELLEAERDLPEFDLQANLLLAETYATLAVNYQAAGSNNDMLRYLDQAADLILSLDGREDLTPKDLLSIARNATNITTRLASVEARIEATRKLLALSEKLCRLAVQAEPKNAKPRYQLATTLAAQGQSFMWWGRENAEAFEALHSAVARIDEVIALDGEKPTYLRTLQVSLLNLAVIYGRLKQFSEKEKVGRRALDVSRRLAALQPDDIRMHQNLGQALSNSAFAAKSSGNLESAKELYSECREVGQRMIELFPDHVESGKCLCKAIKWQAVLEFDDGNFDQAAAMFEELVNQSSRQRGLFRNETRLLQDEIVGRVYGAWASYRAGRNNEVVGRLTGLEDCFENYYSIYERDLTKDSNQAFLAILPMSELASLCIQESVDSLEEGQGTPMTKSLRNDLEQARKRLDADNVQWRAKWIAKVLGGEFDFATVLAYSEEYDPPAKFFFVTPLQKEFSDLADSSMAIALSRLFRGLSTEVANSGVDDSDILTAVVFVVSSAPNLVDHDVLRQLLERLDVDQAAGKLSKAWGLFRLDEFEACKALLDSEQLKGLPDNCFIKSIIAARSGGLDEARREWQLGSDWLETNSDVIRKRRSSPDSHRIPHLAALQRLQYEAELLLGSTDAEQ